jgi:predicted permease
MNINNKIIILSFLLSIASFASSVDSGASLFQGTKAFKNGGVACIACHNINNPKVIGGGSLAKDLTMYGGKDMAPTVGMMITAPEAMPSPLMTRAYKTHHITKDEQKDLVAFFTSVDSKSTQKGFATLFWIFGLIGAGGIFAGLTILGKKRIKNKSVNQDMFDRQLKSTWRV